MTEALMLMLACLAGNAIGMLFFVGLWWTLRKGLRSRVPALWFVGSLIAANDRCHGRILSGLRPSLGTTAGVPTGLCHGPPNGGAVHPGGK